jgi:hypothetical protein
MAGEGVSSLLRIRAKIASIAGVGLFSDVSSLAGNALGGLFGGPDPNPWSTWHNTPVDNKPVYNSDGSLKAQGELSSKHMSGDFGNQLGTQIVDLNQRIHKLTGIDMSNVRNIAVYEKNYGGFITLDSPFHKGPETYVPENVFYFNAESPQEQQAALQKYAYRLIETRRPDLSPEQINQYVGQALYSPQEGQFQGSVPLLKKASGQGNESYANFLKRYRETGDINPKLGPNTGA